MDGQHLPDTDLCSLLGWSTCPPAPVPRCETHPNSCLPSSLVQPRCPSLPYSASAPKAQLILWVMKKLPRDGSFLWDLLHFDFTTTDGETTKCEETCKIDPINYYFVFLTVLSKSLDATADCLILPRNGNSPKILILPFTFRTIIHLELLFVFRSK